MIENNNSSQSQTGTPPLIMQTMDQVGAPAWDDFVNRSEDSLPTQASAWESILQQTYGFSCHFLTVLQDGQIQGVLPLFRVKSFLTGDSLQSMAGALCAVSPQAAQALACAADDLARQLGVDYLLLRDSRQPWNDCGLEVLNAHRGVRVHLPTDDQTAWENLNRSLRKDIHKGMRIGNVDTIANRLLIDDFYDVMVEFNHQMGTPLYSKQFLLNVARGFPGRFRTALGYADDKPVASYFCLIHHNKVFGLWGATLHAYIPLMPTHRVYWAIFEDAICEGFEQLDLGRSSYPSSQYDFKEKWGDEVYPIYQLFHIYHGKTPPTLNISQSIHENGQISLFSQAWSKLPLPLARILGPVVRRHIPFG
jgi:FemAB-related protein (PEP-CTERM system-associated)